MASLHIVYMNISMHTEVDMLEIYLKKKKLVNVSLNVTLHTDNERGLTEVRSVAQVYLCKVDDLCR